MDNYDIYIQGAGGTGYKTPVSQLPYTRMVVQSTQDLNAVRVEDFIFLRDN